MADDGNEQRHTPHSSLTQMVCPIGSGHELQQSAKPRTPVVSHQGTRHRKKRPTKKKKLDKTELLAQKDGLLYGQPDVGKDIPHSTHTRRWKSEPVKTTRVTFTSHTLHQGKLTCNKQYQPDVGREKDMDTPHSSLMPINSTGSDHDVTVQQQSADGKDEGYFVCPDMPMSHRFKFLDDLDVDREHEQQQSAESKDKEDEECLVSHPRHWKPEKTSHATFASLTHRQKRLARNKWYQPYVSKDTDTPYSSAILMMNSTGSNHGVTKRQRSLKTKRRHMSFAKFKMTHDHVMSQVSSQTSTGKCTKTDTVIYNYSSIVQETRLHYL